MKKSFVGHCAKMLVAAMIGVCLMGCDDAFINKSLEKANAAINEGDYITAYAIADEMIAQGHHNVRDAGYDLNRKILNDEIAATIDSAEGTDAAMKIIFIIKERAQYNVHIGWKGEEKVVEEECKMLKLAIQLTKIKGDEVCSKKLQEVMDELKVDNSKRDFWGDLGTRIINGIDDLGDKLSD